MAEGLPSATNAEFAVFYIYAWRPCCISYKCQRNWVTNSCMHPSRQTTQQNMTLSRVKNNHNIPKPWTWCCIGWEKGVQKLTLAARSIKLWRLMNKAWPMTATSNFGLWCWHFKLCSNVCKFALKSSMSPMARLAPNMSNFSGRDDQNFLCVMVNVLPIAFTYYKCVFCIIM